MLGHVRSQYSAAERQLNQLVEGRRDMDMPTVKDLMRKEVAALSPEMSIEDAINFLLKHGVSGAPVVDADHKLMGVLSEKDCLRIFANGAYNVLPGGLVNRYMSTNVMTVTPGTDLFTLADILLKNPFRRLPVVDGDGVLVGQVSRRDVLAGTGKIWGSSPIQKEWTDSKYLTDEIKAALSSRKPRVETQVLPPKD